MGKTKLSEPFDDKTVIFKLLPCHNTYSVLVNDKLIQSNEKLRKFKASQEYMMDFIPHQLQNTTEEFNQYIQKFNSPKKLRIRRGMTMYDIIKQIRRLYNISLPSNAIYSLLNNKESREEINEKYSKAFDNKKSSKVYLKMFTHCEVWGKFSEDGKVVWWFQTHKTSFNRKMLNNVREIVFKNQYYI